MSATGAHRSEGFPYAIDNGAWTAHQQGAPFDEDAFLRLVESHGNGADWIVVPDIVAGGLESLAFSEGWLPRLDGCGAPLLVAVQDGMGREDVEHLVPHHGIFVGGSTDWKLATLEQWGALRSDTGCYVHVGRVNTRRRIRMCEGRADSFDGTSATRYAVTLPALDGARRQLRFDAC